MKNIDRIIKEIKQTGSKNIMLHTIPKTKNWLICKKIKKKEWAIVLASPLGNTSFNLGTIKDTEYIELWEEIIKTKIESSNTLEQIKNEITEVIYNFKRKKMKLYNKFLKKYETNDKKFRKKIQRDKKQK